MAYHVAFDKYAQAVAVGPWRLLL